MICPDRGANAILSDNIVAPSLAPLVHISFTALPNPYNGFDRDSTFPVTISLNSPRWNDESKQVLTPAKGNIVKITGFISSIHSDEDKVNHWVVLASEIYFIKESPQASKPAIPGTGEPASNLLFYYP